MKATNADTEMTDEITKAPKVPFFVHLFNPIVRSFHRIGVPMGPTILLTVHGRKTDRPHTTPVGLFEHDGRRYVFATFGEVNWVLNLRAAGEAIIGHGRHRETVTTVELSPEEAANVMRHVMAPYLSSRMRRSFLRMSYDLEANASTDDYLREARLHPGFELHPKEIAF